MISNTWNRRSKSTGLVRTPNPSRPWYRFARQLLSERSLPSKKRETALDVGSGVGEFMLVLREMGFSVEGVDGSEEQMQIIYSLGLNGKVTDLENGLPYADEAFSLVTCLELVEHIARAEDLLSEIRRVLRPKGHLLLSAPNFSYWNHRIRYLFGARPFNESIHLRYFNKKSLLSLFKDAGFRIIGQNSYGPVPLLSTFLIRIFHQGPPLWHVKGRMESFLAYDFVYLAVKE